MVVSTVLPKLLNGPPRSYHASMRRATQTTYRSCRIVHHVRRNHAVIKSCHIFICGFCLLAFPFKAYAQPAEEVLGYLKSLGNGSYLFGQMATWVHNEDPDMTHPSNWIKKVHDHTEIFPRYACITYDFHDDPFSDAEWNEGVKKLHDRGMIVGVYTFFANPTGGTGMILVRAS